MMNLGHPARLRLFPGSPQETGAIRETRTYDWGRGDWAGGTEPRMKRGCDVTT